MSEPRLAFVFPGQGAQYAGMGKELAENFAEAAAVFSQADQISGYKLSELCFAGPEAQLNKTEFAQPALLATSIAAYEVVKKHGIKATMMAGLSLGEYSALAAAGAVSLAEALPLVQNRARLMQEAVPPGEGAMAAVVGLDPDRVKEACLQTGGNVAIANYNCPGQLVISGARDAVMSTIATIKAGGGRAVPLAISVPSHSTLMSEAAARLEPYLNAIQWQEPMVPVVSNVNAQANGAAQFTSLLVQQLFSPVLWEQSVRYMMEQVDYFIEIGPGSTLSGLIKKIDRNRVLGQVEDLKSLAKMLEKVGSL
ncbi:MAG: ACP S-malonyltransferase [Syntrophomonadaceae bacterium]|nr:ACP S-malonyltransferase [Syntrophomonadaceae bacterium]